MEECSARLLAWVAAYSSRLRYQNGWHSDLVG